MSKLRVSEVFLSVEGEGPYTGHPTLFIRFFGCNFTCFGFGQSKPAHVLSYEPVADRKELERQEFHRGCDSAYSWHPAFKNLVTDYTIATLVDEVRRVIGVKDGEKLARNKRPILCFTGGEPMLYQDHLGAIYKSLEDVVSKILIETNGSISAKDSFYDSFDDTRDKFLDLNWAVSPKLSNSGELWEKAINPKAWRSYIGNKYLKFVSDGSEESIIEIYKALDAYSSEDYVLRSSASTLLQKVWLMPEGASAEQLQKIQRKVANICIREGFNFCARVHVWVYDNEIGT